VYQVGRCDIENCKYAKTRGNLVAGRKRKPEKKSGEKWTDRCACWTRCMTYQGTVEVHLALSVRMYSTKQITVCPAVHSSIIRLSAPRPLSSHVRHIWLEFPAALSSPYRSSLYGTFIGGVHNCSDLYSLMQNSVNEHVAKQYYFNWFTFFLLCKRSVLSSCEKWHHT
jgi:hypothetical protein